MDQAQLQEWLAFTAVAIAFLAVFLRVFRFGIAPPLARYLLKQGKVKWAMRLHSLNARKPAKPGKRSSSDCCS